MDDNWPDLLRPGAFRRLPRHVYAALVGQLLALSWSITLLEALLVALIGGLAAWRAQDLPLALLAASTSFLVLMLPVAANSLRRSLGPAAEPEEIRKAELRFELHIWGASLGIGLMAARALLAFDDPLLHLTLVALALGSVITNLRDHFRPMAAFGKTVAILGPVSVAAILTGEPYYQLLGLGGLLAAKLVLDIVLSLYRASLDLRLVIDEKERLTDELHDKARELERLQSERIQSSRFSAMGAMGSALAHELNQPLTAIANYARGSGRLLVEPSPEQLEMARQGIAAAEAGALRAGEIIRRIRSLVDGRGGVQRREDLGNIAREARDFACSDAAARAADCRIEIPTGQMFVYADSIQIQQVLINLIRNALEAVADVQAPRIVIAACAADGVAEISIADNGPGIVHWDAEDLFQAFRSTKREGLGMGLSISRAIVEAHGGRIWSGAGSDGGAEFRFTIPLAENPEGQDRRAAA